MSAQMYVNGVSKELDGRRGRAERRVVSLLSARAPSEGGGRWIGSGVSKRVIISSKKENEISERKRNEIVADPEGKNRRRSVPRAENISEDCFISCCWW